VGWEDAEAFCRWLSAKTGKRYRLPTEAEWEYAASGPEHRDFPWGKMFHNSYCNNMEAYKDNREEMADIWDKVPSPVGYAQFVRYASPFGCVDLAGNVWEWCADWYDPGYYKKCDERGSVTDPVSTDSSITGFRVMRGGSFDSNPGSCRVSNRAHGTFYFDAGFRVAETP
jgi:formylglycine-generating enzyme required for sulfatase activity